jgi:hypothetical protein
MKMTPPIEDSIESDWAIARPNRRSAEELAKVEQEGRGFAWIGFMSRRKPVGSRIMIPIPAPMRVIIQETAREQEIQIFQLKYVPKEAHEVDALHLYLSEVGNEPVARLILSRRTVSSYSPLTLGFRITGFGYLNACWLTKTSDPIPTLAHDREDGDEVESRDMGGPI